MLYLHKVDLNKVTSIQTRPTWTRSSENRSFQTRSAHIRSSQDRSLTLYPCVLYPFDLHHPLTLPMTAHSSIFLSSEHSNLHQSYIKIANNDSRIYLLSLFCITSVLYDCNGKVLINSTVNIALFVQLLHFCIVVCLYIYSPYYNYIFILPAADNIVDAKNRLVSVSICT